MPRNTLIVVFILAIFTAVLVGVNLGNRGNSPTQVNTPTPTIQPTPSPISLATYKNTNCGFSFKYPSTLTLLDNGVDSAVFTNPDNAKDAIIVSCQKSIPKPTLAATSIESFSIGSASGKLFHDKNKENLPMDKFIIHNSTSNKDMYIAGFGSTFDAILPTISLL